VAVSAKHPLGFQNQNRGTFACMIRSTTGKQQTPLFAVLVPQQFMTLGNMVSIVNK
jgi:hypothetical protein